MPQASDTAVQQLAARVIAGELRALARAISLVENEAPEAAQLLAACFPHTGNALRIGITGAPGAGKSTLVDCLARAWRETGRKVGILAVDPTSPFTGGAILGDRIRMADRAVNVNGLDDNLYIRSMATRGTLGGLARATADAALLIEASGKDIVLIETVGVGQDEIDIVRLADITLVVLVPGMGDDVQSLKAGIMEIAGLYVINKADHEGADRVEKEIRAMQSLAQTHEPRPTPILRTIATNGTGTTELLAAIDDTTEWLSNEGRLQARRKQYWRTRMEEMLRHALMQQAKFHGLTTEDLTHHAERAASKQQNPYQLIPSLVAEIFHAQKHTASIDHLGIAVADIAEAEKLYESLGLRITHRETVEHEQVSVAMIPMQGARLELLQPTSPDSPVGRFLNKRGQGLHHVALQVDDIQLTLAALKSQGASLVNEQIQTGAGGHLYFFVHPKSASGVLLEICQAVPPQETK